MNSGDSLKPTITSPRLDTAGQNTDPVGTALGVGGSFQHVGVDLVDELPVVQRTVRVDELLAAGEDV